MTTQFTRDIAAFIRRTSSMLAGWEVQFEEGSSFSGERRDLFAPDGRDVKRLIVYTDLAEYQHTSPQRWEVYPDHIDGEHAHRDMSIKRLAFDIEDSYRTFLPESIDLFREGSWDGRVAWVGVDPSGEMLSVDEGFVAVKAGHFTGVKGSDVLKHGQVYTVPSSEVTLGVGPIYSAPPWPQLEGVKVLATQPKRYRRPRTLPEKAVTKKMTRAEKSAENKRRWAEHKRTGKPFKSVSGKTTKKPSKRKANGGVALNTWAKTVNKALSDSGREDLLLTATSPEEAVHDAEAALVVPSWAGKPPKAVASKQRQARLQKAFQVLEDIAMLRELWFQFLGYANDPPARYAITRMTRKDADAFRAAGEKLETESSEWRDKVPFVKAAVGFRDGKQIAEDGMLRSEFNISMGY
jgi:hypothetical protein